MGKIKPQKTTLSLGKLEVNISNFLNNKSFNNWYVKYDGIL